MMIKFIFHYNYLLGEEKLRPNQIYKNVLYKIQNHEVNSKRADLEFSVSKAKQFLQCQYVTRYKVSVLILTFSVQLL